MVHHFHSVQYNLVRLFTSFCILFFALYSTTTSLLGSNNNVKTTVILMGDSMLDNFYWVKNHQLDVRQQLENRGYIAHNYAISDSKVEDILNGRDPIIYDECRKDFGLKSYYSIEEQNELQLGGKKVYPLTLFHNNHNVDPKPTVVISAGLSNIILNIYETKATIIDHLKNLIGIYKKIIDEIRKSNKNADIVLIMPYLPFIEDFFQPQYERYHQGLTLEDFTAIYEVLFNILSTTAANQNCQIINLATTFNPKDREDYGKTCIETSNKSGEYIADLIAEVINDKKREKNKSYVYARKVGHFQRVLNDEKMQDNYHESLKKHLGIQSKENDNSHKLIIALVTSAIVIRIVHWYLQKRKSSEAA